MEKVGLESCYGKASRVNVVQVVPRTDHGKGSELLVWSSWWKVLGSMLW